jgi:hypothetical protein
MLYRLLLRADSEAVAAVRTESEDSQSDLRSEPAALAFTSKASALIDTPEIYQFGDVVFTLGAGLSAGPGKEIGSGGFNTNLIGAAAGAVFDAIDATPLKDYMLNNVSAGTAIPFNGSTKLSAQITLGFGGLDLGKAQIWPVVGLEQTDTADARTPRALVTRNPSAGNWSSPLFAVGLVPMSLTKTQENLGKGKLVPIISIGLRIPYYYPNDPFSALVALFTNKRSDYVKEGKVRFEAGITIPLTRVRAPCKGADSTACKPKARRPQATESQQ